MPRAIWSGAISFGLVSVPVKLYSAVSRKNVRFNQLDSETNSRVRQKRVNAEGEEVPYEKIVKGYEIAKDSYVVVTDDELAALAPKATRMIDISDFVDESEIDPIFYDSAYYLAPEELARKSYALLAQAMEDSNRVAIASFVMRTKQYLVAIRPKDGRLMMSTMVYADELVASDDVPGLEELDEFEASEAELAMAAQLIDSLTSDFEPERYEDSYREQVLELLEAKAAGEVTSIEAPAAAEDEGVVDLLAALEASVSAAKESRRSGPTAGSGNGAKGTKSRAKSTKSTKAKSKKQAEEAEVEAKSA
ncbi:MAG: Ku protein [Acidimicrobiia bacterium]|nr:Ku protein [Acidimicrobiia bacterium]